MKNEIKTVLSNKELSEEVFKEMPLLHNFILEVLRMHPPVPVFFGRARLVWERSALWIEHATTIQTGTWSNWEVLLSKLSLVSVLSEKLWRQLILSVREQGWCSCESTRLSPCSSCSERFSSDTMIFLSPHTSKFLFDLESSQFVLYTKYINTRSGLFIFIYWLILVFI